MKVIFLDIDGVLCSDRSSHAYGGMPKADNTVTWDKFDRVAIELLKCAIRKTGAQIVLSSSWRESVSVPTLEYCLGINIMSTTRVGFDEDTRGSQIADWLAENPVVTQYAIVDDDDEFTDQQTDRLCRTSKRNGFLLGHYEELLEMLE